MFLSNRLTFSIFSILLVALFTFVVPQAMAEVTVTVSAEYTPDDATTSATDEAELVVKFTYSRDAWPEPVAADFTTGGTALAESETFAKVDERNYTITLADFAAVAEGNTSTTSALNLVGWQDVTVAVTWNAAVTANPDADPPVLAKAAHATYVITPTGGTASASAEDATAVLVVVTATTHLAPDAYLVIANNNTAIANDTIFPTLPTIVPAIVKGAWFEHDNDADTTDATGAGAMPDLYKLLQVGGGGTLNLTLLYDHDGDTTNDKVRFGSVKGTGTSATPDKNHNRNLRYVVINEVNWAYDNKHVGTANRTQQQWIEVLNRSTRPFPLADIVLTTSKEFPAPKPETDRLTNIPSYTNTWDITDKGQHGNSGETDGSGKVEFISMHRTGYGDGSDPEHWAKAGDYFLPNFKGTPGSPNSVRGVQETRTKPAVDTPAKDKIVINEIGNLADGPNDKKLDWVELKNITDTPQSLDKWALSIVTKTAKTATTDDIEARENEIVRFPEISIPPKGVLLLVNAAPTSTAFAAGNDVKKKAGEQAFGADGNVSYLIVKGEENYDFTGVDIDIPGNDAWMLVLRSGQPWNVKKDDDDENVYDVYGSGFQVEDVAGPALIEVKDLEVASPRKEKKADGKDGGDIWETTLYPLNGRSETGDKHVQHEREEQLARHGYVHARNTDLHGFQKDALIQVGFTGVGYDRNVPEDAVHGGTPGYDNDVTKGKVADLDGASLVISELMLTTDGGRYPQWIELHNTSKTKAIDLAADEDNESESNTGWQIKIENHNSGTWRSANRPLNVTVNLKDWFTVIPPNQTVLIVAAKGRNSESKYFPDTRVAGIFDSKRTVFKMTNRRGMFLNAAGGFRIDIVDGSGNVSDSVGNLDGKASNARAGIGLDDPVGFDWPTALAYDEERTSLVRLRDDDGVPRVGVPTRAADGSAMDSKGSVIPMGENWRGKNAKVGTTGAKMLVWSKYKDAAWVHASDTQSAAQNMWYGSKEDYGTPLHTAGTPLPVTLSFFRPTLEDGQVVIQWTTESELDNAGFNILRSDSRDGEFVQVNANMIQGNGTTGERSTYKWVDTTAKPDAVYYYQIEDVSLAGEHNTLATTKLKGLISAKGKLTTTWSDIKRTSQ